MDVLMDCCNGSMSLEDVAPSTVGDEEYERNPLSFGLGTCLYLLATRKPARSIIEAVAVASVLRGTLTETVSRPPGCPMAIRETDLHQGEIRASHDDDIHQIEMP